MNTNATYIKQRLSLREPLQQSLDIISEIAAKLSLKKDADLASELALLMETHPSCTSFERDFPSVCFSIATGIGKTRLMGACIAYLYLEKGIRHFFVLAPNLTIYEKLIEDFGNPSNPKYVFNGIAAFVNNRPQVITGDNYASFQLFKDTDIRINVFNISKFNKDATTPRGKEKGKLPRIKRLSEYLGQSYWEYLSTLDDLVILMDEAHRYKADASVAAINELKPVLGIELTATPLDEKGNAYKNIVFEYNLAQALKDGKYVKNPAIGYRSDFEARGRPDEEIERIKLEDSVSLHEEVKNELEIYANTYGKKKVKPFILVVCRDTQHSAETLKYIQSREFYEGQYAGKVIQIDSSVSEEENARLLATIENYENPVEIVIHVNMLAEGWDVSNLYTICPLRKADSIKLIEQTIGRGLRLPYNGERTGVEKIDRLTVVAHDNFTKVIDAAKEPGSILNRFTFIKINEEIAAEKMQPMVSLPGMDREQQEEQEKIDKIEKPEQKQAAQQILDARKAITHKLQSIGKMEGVTCVEDFQKPEIREKVIESIEKDLSTGQQNIFKDQMIQEANSQYQSVVAQYKENIIEIPRIDLVQDEIKVWFEDFDLDTREGFDVRLLKEEIRVKGLVDHSESVVGIRYGAFRRDSPENQIISELWNFPEVDYEENQALINKLVHQAKEQLKKGLEDAGEFQTLVRQSRKIIATRIYEQMKAHFRQSVPQYSKPTVLPFTRIEPWNFSAMVKNGIKDYKETVPARDIKKYVFMGFRKSCHLQYKFDSTPEKILSHVLESDSSIQKWLRPAESQFRIYWKQNSRKYHPDFVAERPEAYYIVEVKAENEIESAEVQDKKQAALHYCQYATEYNEANGKKPWKYVIIPDNVIKDNSSFNGLLNAEVV
jgi:type III restriction enzyme